MLRMIASSSGRARLRPDLMYNTIIDNALHSSRRFLANQTPQPQPWVNPVNRVPGQALKQYSTDLTQLAEEGKLDPVIGRHEEIRRALQILARRTKSNPVLIGEV